MSLRSQAMEPYRGVPPVVEKLWNGRIRITRWFEGIFEEDTFDNKLEREIFQDFGSLDSAAQGETPDTLRENEAYTNARLVSQRIFYIPNEPKTLVEKVYETLTSNFVEEVDVSTQENESGQRVATRTIIAIAGTDYTGVVGSTTYVSQPTGLTEKTLYLADFKIEDTDAYRRVVETYKEYVVLSKREGDGPNNLPQLKTHVWQVVGTEPTDIPGVITDKTKDNIEGITTFRYTSVSNTADENPTSGNLYDYVDVISVRIPGTVTLRNESVNISFLAASATGDIPLIDSIPASTKKVEATTTVSLSTSSTPSAANIAYNLEGYGVSATITKNDVTSANYSYSARSLSYPNSRIIGVGNISGAVDFTTSGSLFRQENSTITLTGKTENVSETGRLSYNARPLFTAIDGDTYYLITEVTV